MPRQLGLPRQPMPPEMEWVVPAIYEFTLITRKIKSIHLWGDQTAGSALGGRRSRGTNRRG